MAPAEKVQRYEAFVSDVLQRDLQHVLRHRDAVFEQLAQLLQLRNVLERLQDLSGPLQTQVDLGCNVYVSAEVPDPSRVCVALGYGFFAELTLPEALHFIHRRSLLLSQVCGSFRGSRTCLRSCGAMSCSSPPHSPHGWGARCLGSLGDGWGGAGSEVGRGLGAQMSGFSPCSGWDGGCNPDAWVLCPG
ncbi:protein UXT isoform X1 [Alligator mississippiensis]|uniref:protein UXT isoform X1 n=1 Tax=Alligator mississippiensis TaxID=8496 RepID=UPI0028773A75|nr:protein UXT isoform X1 [Alligator mississippiensis]